MIGRTLAHYEITARLGEGGMGEVWRAKDTALHREVAVKVLPAEMAADPERLERFRREAQAIAALNHPNIVTVYSVEEAEGLQLLTMELVEGKSLDQLLPPSGFDLERLFPLAIQTADALAAAHEKGITHRDLKPANVMVTVDGRVKVLDFGLAKLADQEEEAEETQLMTREGMVLGTVPYMAPEQVQGKPVDHRSDIFSLGILLYEMATGERPFRGDNAASVISAVLKDHPPAVTEIKTALPNHLGRIIQHCLEKNPERRYQSAKDVRNELESLQGEVHTGGLPKRQRVTAPPKAAARRSPWIWVVAAAALAIAAGAVYIWGPGGPPRTEAESPMEPPGVSSLAVLPFTNLSGEEENEYFADGMTEEINSRLSRLDRVRVASRTSVARFKNTERDIRDVAAELDVGYVLEGSVRRAGDQVRITAQLIDAGSGFQVWADDFKRDLEDIFEVQEETALKIAEALDLQLTVQEREEVQRPPTSTPEAYEQYIRGLALSEYFDQRDKLEAARGHFEAALELDPDFVQALAGLSKVERRIYRNLEPLEEHLQRAEELAQRAVALEPDIAETRIAVGDVHGARYDYGRAAEEFRRAAELEPDNAHAWERLSWALSYQQPPDALGAERAARESIRLNPSSFVTYYQLGRALLPQGRLDEAEEAFEHARRLNPDFYAPYIGLSLVELARGNPDRALDLSLKDPHSSQIREAVLAQIHAAGGRQEQALANLETALESGYRDFRALDVSPYLEKLRTDSRYEELIRRYRQAEEGPP